MLNKKLLLLGGGLFLSMLLASCFKDDLDEFKSIKRIELNEEIAVAAITQRLDYTFYNPIGQVSNVTFTIADTAFIDLPKQTDTSEFIIDEVQFKTRTENRYTNGGTFKMVFLDSLGNRKDSLPDGGPWTIGAGSAASPSVNNFSITIDTARYNLLARNRKVVLQLTLNTGVAGIPSGYNVLDFTYFVGVRAKGRVKSDIDLNNIVSF
ncbi:MAG: hypothetical protein MUF42_01735 [Cytophagaceae bacterium]|jgi:hypothetical protein|nr:hypothetical protein [Cytophagaceae bacterium]